MTATDTLIGDELENGLNDKTAMVTNCIDGSPYTVVKIATSVTGRRERVRGVSNTLGHRLVGTPLVGIV